MSEFSHVDESGEVRMVDIGAKPVTARVATARAVVAMRPSTRDALFGGDLPKGDAVATVRIAAIQAAKRTSDLIPLCHPLAIDAVEVRIEPSEDGAMIEVDVSTSGRTGVEMEAMTAASVGALALYDMIKGVDREASIAAVELLAKRGGASGDWQRG